MRVVSQVLICLAVLGLGATARAAAPVPAPLEAWREWVLHDHLERLCPPPNDADDAEPACRWPGELALDVAADGLRFTQAWTLYAPQRVPLPGDARWRPLDVQVDGIAAAVVLDEDRRPSLDLAPGTHRIDGRIAWTQRPSTLPLPAEIAWVSLRVDGEAVARPQRNEDDELVLGATAEAEGDALQIEAYRLLADGAPPWLATRIVLSVAGKPRELLLGPVLPKGFVPVALDGEIPLRWEADDRLRLQLRPGLWAVTIIARAPADLAALDWPAVPAPWAEQELWQFRAAPQFRIAQLDGVPGVDPEQAGAPDWNDGLGAATLARWGWLFDAAGELPAYLFAPDARATLAIGLRGLPPQRPARLTLAREMWLDFDGDEFIARDRVSGDLGGAARLDMRAPWQLEQAQRDGDQSLLVTRGATPQSSGIEWRDPDVRFESGARVARVADLPASGWTHAFDQAGAVLHLPPGYRLIAARGADAADGSWLARWSLLDLFLASVALLLAWRLRPLLALLLAGWLLWSWHEPQAPRLTLLLLLGLGLALRHVPAGRWQRALWWSQRVTLVVVGLWSLLFAATQLRLALYPQLEHDGVEVASGRDQSADGEAGGMVQATMEEAPMPASAPVPDAMPEQRRAKASNAQLDQIQVSGSRINRMDLFKYPTDAIPQAGNARPDWQWHRHALRWSGPLLPDETLSLWISPPWLTRLLRVAAVLLLGAALLQLVRRARSSERAPSPRVAGNALGAVLFATTMSLAAVSPSLQAQATPDQAMLDALRERLLAHDEPCRPACAGLAAVTATRVGDTLALALDAHAQAWVAWPLPRAGDGQALVEIRVDGAAAAARQDANGAWILLSRGVHRVEARYASDDARWRIAFPLAPASVVVAGDALEVSGVDDARLIGDTLEVVARRRSDAGGERGDDGGEAIPPFVRVQRHLLLDQQWSLQTRVTRIAPERAGLTVAVPLLPGELPLEGAPPQRDGMALVSLAAGAEEISWSSRLTPTPEFTLSAPQARGYAEEWLLDVAPLLHAEVAGVPEAGGGEAGVRRFLPLPGETLTLTVTRPEAIEGATLAIEGVQLRVTPGQRARDSRLEFTLRSTRAGQHRLPLPAQSELLGLWIDGVEQPRVLDDGRVALPLRSAAQRVVVSWREPVPIGMRSATPALDLGAAAANLRIALAVPEDRWLLAASGPGVGPALLYWPQLALLLLLAWGLARYGGTPLRLHQWLLLGLGFSTVSWAAALVVAAWLLLLGWRSRRIAPSTGRRFALLQIGIAGATLVALLCLVAAVPAGLLGSPDMQVTGNGSWARELNWFVDRSAAQLPAATAYSLPLWVYKSAILLWALWLANALVGWLRWGWASFSAGGRWHWPARAPHAPAATTVASVPPIDTPTA